MFCDIKNRLDEQVVHNILHDYLEIKHIAVSKNARGQGIGRKMITALQQENLLTVEAETHDGAVDFYRQCGFKTAAIQKHGVRRWVCVLSYDKTKNQDIAGSA